MREEDLGRDYHRVVDEAMVRFMEYGIVPWTHSADGGYHLEDKDGKIVGGWDAPPGWDNVGDEDYMYVPSKFRWSPSTDLNHAWRVVEEMRRREWVLCMCTQMTPSDVKVEFSKWRDHEIPSKNVKAITVIENSAPLAICKAALIVYGLWTM